VLFLDLRLFLERIDQVRPVPSQLAPGLLLGSLVLILLAFVHIFSNVWGYVEPVSPFFRNKLWLAYFIPSAGLCLLVLGKPRVHAADEEASAENFPWAWGGFAGLVLLGTLVGLVPGKRVQVESGGRTSLLVMTYNIQQANDRSAEKSYQAQLALIRRVSPDILALQETDSARISLNNNDYVRYYAEKLGYYSYYGPTTVAGTYGTAILSKFPLLKARSVFTYSDTDEVGVAEAEVEVGGRRFSIYDVHPDGSEAAMLAFANALIRRTRSQAGVIALGDYNLRDTEAAYQLLDGVFTNAWTSVYPSKIGAGVDMSGRNRIDHIFLSPDLSVRDPLYLLPPASATDHPVHWAVVTWGDQ
jgi:endonuclease/exonuclease/phosphatase family metal-dependent hydrolase